MTSYRIGYVRHSGLSQEFDLQVEALRTAGCHRVYDGIADGVGSSGSGFAAALDNLRDGDTLVVWKLDHLEQDIGEFLDFAAGLSARGIDFVSLADEIDTTTVSSRFHFFKFIESLARLDQKHEVEKLQAKSGSSSRGARNGGRKPIMTDEKLQIARNLLKRGVSPRDVAGKVGVSVPTLYRWIPATSRGEAS